MNEQKLQDIVSHIDYLISELNHLRNKITLEDGVHFNIIHEKDMFAIELWDTELLEPRILSFFNSKQTDSVIERECTKALNSIATSPRIFKKQIYWNSDIVWELLPEKFRILDSLYKIEKRELSDDLRKIVKERIHALYSVSE